MESRSGSCFKTTLKEITMQATMTTVAFARFNIQLAAHQQDQIEIAKLQELLHGAAIWGCADDVEVFYSEENNVVGVSIPVEEDIASVLEAGSVLGICQRIWEESDAYKGSTWLSLVTPTGEVIYSPLSY
jgi:hypothetical protein